MMSSGDFEGVGSVALLSELDPDNCRRLLGEHAIGRVAWTSTQGPELFPVSYAFDDGMVFFRTSPYGALSALGRPTQVVFEVDEFDATRRSGWSVIVRGSSAAVSVPMRTTEAWAGYRPLPWVGGSRNLVIGITLQQISGRQFGHREEGH